MAGPAKLENHCTSAFPKDFPALRFRHGWRSPAAISSFYDYNPAKDGGPSEAGKSLHKCLSPRFSSIEIPPWMAESQSLRRSFLKFLTSDNSLPLAYALLHHSAHFKRETEQCNKALGVVMIV